MDNLPSLISGLQSSVTSFFLVFLAELGDKSQLVCMTLAARYSAGPVMLGAGAAFLLLNALAVLFGSVVANWLPTAWLATVVAVLFAFFGIQSLRQAADDETTEVPSAPNRQQAAITAFIMIFLAEFGDKTQLAVAGLSTHYAPLPVWLGASAALLLSAALGIAAGQAWLKRLPIHWFHRAAGIFFLALAALTASQISWT